MDNNIISISNSANTDSSAFDSVILLTETKYSSEIPSPQKVSKHEQVQPQPLILNLSSKSNSTNQEGIESQGNSKQILNSQSYEFDQEQEEYVKVQEQIAIIGFESYQKQQILHQLSQINQINNQIKPLNLLDKKQDIHNFQQALLQMISEYNNIKSKITGIQLFCGKKDDLKKQEQKMLDFVREFYFSLSNFMESGNEITVSQIVNHAGIIEDNSVCIPINLTLCSREKQLPHPIESEILIPCDNHKKFVKLMFEQQLLQTIKEKLEKLTIYDGENKNTKLQTISSMEKLYWMEKIEKSLNNKNKSVFLNVEFDRMGKILIIHPQKERPFIITHTNCPIYLAPQQILQMENNLKITIDEETVDFAAISVIKLKVFQQNDQTEKKQTPVQFRTIPESKDFKLERIKLKLEKDQPNNQFAKNYEFYLKSNEIDLKNQLPGIKGILKNDMKGFTIVPPENQQYKLYTAAALATKAKVLKFSLEVHDDFWITVEYDLKKHKLFD